MEHFENVLNRQTVVGKDTEENEKVCDTLNVKKDLFCEEELAVVLKELRNSKAPGADNGVSELLKCGVVRNKLPKILNQIFEKKGKYLTILGKT